MSDQQRSALWLAIATILIGSCTLLWFHFLEKRPAAVSWRSVEAEENPMLAATRLLKQHRFTVRQSETLEQALTPGLGKGNMFINASSGDIDDKQMKSLMNWVAAGNTLVFQPRWSGKLDIVRSSKEGECGKMVVRTTEDDDEDDDDEDARRTKDDTGRDDKTSDETGKQSDTETQTKAEDKAEGQPGDKPGRRGDDHSAPVNESVSQRPALPHPATRLAAAGADNDSGAGGASGGGKPAGQRQASANGEETEASANNSANSSANESGKESANGSAKASAESKADDDEDETARKIRENAEKAMDERAQDVASGKPDQIARRLHLELRRIQYLRERKEDRLRAMKQTMRDAPCVSQVRWPGASYDLRIDNRYGWFKPLTGATAATISDNNGEALRIYREGKGHIVLVAENYFNNHMLARYDHAELLLQVMQLNDVPHKLTIIQHLSNRQWYEKLWDHFSLMLMSLALLLALLLWAAVRRFGAVLPLPEPERRALLEHVDASGRWLWQVEKGGQTMLDAMRKLVDKTLSRRVPQLVRMSHEEQLEFLAQATRMNRLALELALFKPVATLPQQFIRQIYTLQQLRKHYER